MFRKHKKKKTPSPTFVWLFHNLEVLVLVFQWPWILYVIHWPCRLVVVVLAETSNGAHVIVIFALSAGLLSCVFACVTLDVFYSMAE